MQAIDKRIRAGLILFWALYFSIVWSSNTADALKTLSILPTNWTFVSGNYTLIVRVLAIYQSPTWLARLFFGGVILWEALGAIYFWKAFGAVNRQTLTQTASIHRAFGVTIGLWAAFILADEVFLAYMLGGLSTTHYLLLLSELASFILVRQLDKV
ncbi:MULTISPECIES: hypothetical protein [unclassified Spirosoma]|uniref:hypothetical protein n=1 Tax=unclassified Spirosoma TaxID=2621999 RepID=UPI00095F556D|nr:MULTISPECIES: hypothetical protein [unclassified Spirosoma]MBN8825161.1 hypothetical protein [Spirosoma sp.]OJW77154.1 MAG: hypothetical protein BGO59_31325 [Spirosoma sp. 48-14]